MSLAVVCDKCGKAVAVPATTRDPILTLEFATSYGEPLLHFCSPGCLSAWLELPDEVAKVSHYASRPA